ncbi:hypothetical protein SASPL_153650 [Salvia splendens]|uniref:phospholipase A2 n=1 Tax=Salvia splendens TaxID=180675 RepID=A0A8X8VYQ9_SALSN|nr:phospholipase A2-alpha-like [Salvia splendens]KAG6384831.1 hypothetical protein SASPL_153650 [Salvia splendens]
MAYSPQPSAQSLIFLIASLLISSLYTVQVHSLNIGLQANPGLSLFKECSKTCESMFCDAAPFLRYGKYCGLLYTGCPGEKPCDRLDTCCMHHDQCISKMGNDYLSQQCNKEFLKCVDSFKKSRAPSFKGNTCDVDDVVKSINNAMKAAIVAGRVFGKP